MSVKKMGSKLAQGVRQIKAQQDKAVPAKVLVSAPVVPVTKSASAQSAAKPWPVMEMEATKLHPQRVWPD